MQIPRLVKNPTQNDVALGPMQLQQRFGLPFLPPVVDLQPLGPAFNELGGSIRFNVLEPLFCCLDVNC